MRKAAFFLTVILLIAIAGGSALAATSDSFTIKALVGDDTTPPSTPTILRVDPIAPTQIDVSWSTSTDNFSFGGYRLFRDSTQIATTTLTSFSDTGLTPSTTYTYTVNAFDLFDNTSTTSAPVSTTTPALPVVLTPTSTEEEADTNTGSYLRVELEELTIEPTLRSVTFDFRTRVPARYSLRWGRTSTYDGGYILSDVYRRSHRTTITDLEPDTVYEYELIGYDGAGRPWSLEHSRFRTRAAPDAQPPLNVLGLRAMVEGNDVVLRWDDPPNDDFAYVRVMRSYLFFPGDPQEGFFRYQGGGTNFRDVGALRERDRQFYTVFAYDRNGNVSSGAVVAAERTRSGDGGDSFLPRPEGPYGPPEPSEPIDPAYTTLQARDVTIKQNGRLYGLDAIDIRLYQDDPFTVSVPYEAVPEHLKSIVVDFVGEGDAAFQSYLLRINRDQTAYEAIIPELAFAGRQAEVAVRVFDHLYQQAVTVRGEMTLLSGSDRPSTSGVLFPDRLLPGPREWGIFLFIILALLLVMFLRRRKKAAA